jgi:hypothetical protein
VRHLSQSATRIILCFTVRATPPDLIKYNVTLLLMKKM